MRGCAYNRPTVISECPIQYACIQMASAFIAYINIWARVQGKVITN